MTETQDVATQQNETSREPENGKKPIRPAVDIFEDDTGITLLADMPGVSKERLEVTIDGDSLSIVGNVAIDLPESMDALYADVQTTRYQRSFSLSRELDGENVDAHLKHGLLTLRIPKKEEHRPRKITVHSE